MGFEPSRMLFSPWQIREVNHIQAWLRGLACKHSVPAKLKYRRVYPRSVPCFLVYHTHVCWWNAHVWGGGIGQNGEPQMDGCCNPTWPESPREGSCGSLTRWPINHHSQDPIGTLTPLQLVASLCWLVFNPSLLLQFHLGAKPRVHYQFWTLCNKTLAPWWTSKWLGDSWVFIPSNLLGCIFSFVGFEFIARPGSKLSHCPKMDDSWMTSLFSGQFRLFDPSPVGQIIPNSLELGTGSCGGGVGPADTATGATAACAGAGCTGAGAASCQRWFRWFTSGNSTVCCGKSPSKS